MIRRLLKVNLKGTNNKKHILILVIIAMITTYIKLSILNIANSQSFCMADILILVFGGLNTNFNMVENFPIFTVWIIPNVLLIYLINISTIHNLRERTILVLPRVKKKLDWIISYNITIYIVVIKYYLILFISSLITIFIRMGASVFKNTSIIPNNYNQLIVGTNQYLILLYIVILNIFTMICLVSFINNIYYIFLNSNHAALICMMICFITANVTNSSKVNNFIPINHSMLIRHDLFKYGFEGFNLSFSILYLCIFLTINFILNILIVKKRDISHI